MFLFFACRQDGRGRFFPDTLDWQALFGKRVSYIRRHAMAPEQDFKVVLLTLLVLCSETLTHSFFKADDDEGLNIHTPLSHTNIRTFCKRRFYRVHDCSSLSF